VVMRPNIVESFPLTTKEIWRRYTRIPTDASDIFYHYTTRAGLEGILRSGGLRAKDRIRMNDPGEFDYARNLIYEALDELGGRHDLPEVAQSLTTYTRKNLDRFLIDTAEMSRAFCACLTVSPDDSKQWAAYAEEGRGFAIGFNLSQLLCTQVSNVPSGQPYLLCVPVTYSRNDQRDLVWRSLEAGICDLRTFAETCSQEPAHLTALRDRVTQEIVVQLITLIDFVKAPCYSSEREMRLVQDPNDGTLKARNIQHYRHADESIPFIFMDLRNRVTKRLSLAEIKVGPKATFSKEKGFLEGLLNELGYGSNYRDRPLIIPSQAGQTDL